MSWPMVRLGDVCDEIRERIPSTAISVENYVTTDNMRKNCAGISRAEAMPPPVGLVHYQPGDVLTSNIRPYLKKSWLSDREGGCSSDIIVYRSKRKDLSSEYLYAVLSADSFFDYSMRNVSGAKMPRGKRGCLSDYEFPLPPLPEQKKIVEKVERELKRVEALKGEFARMEKSAADYFKAALAEEFDKVEGERVKLGDVCARLSAGKNIKATYVHSLGEVPVYGANGLRGYTDSSNFDGECVVIGRQGALCGNVRRVSGKAYMTDHAIVAVFDNSANTDYMLYQLKKLNLGRLSTQAAQPGISVCDIREERFVLPKKMTQRAVVARLDSAKSKSEELAAEARRGMAICDKMRKAILAEAFA